MTQADKLVAALCKATDFRIRIDGRTRRTENPIHASDIISAAKGRRIIASIVAPCRLSSRSSTNHQQGEQ